MSTVMAKGEKTGQGPVRTEASLAREAAGLTLPQLAKKAGLTSAGYLAHVERHGTNCPVRAERLARILGCRMEVYLNPSGEASPGKRKSKSTKLSTDPVHKSRQSNGGAPSLEGSHSCATRRRPTKKTAKKDCRPS